MTAVAVRLKKEARALFWPWCAVLAAGLLPLFVHVPGVQTVNWFSFFLGVPLLATLSLGNEFHHHTMPLLLTQPASRLRLWTEKTIVMFAAALSAALVCGSVMFSRFLPGMPFASKLAAAAFVLLVMASASFWALTARSTLGGLLFLAWILSTFYWIVEGSHVVPRWIGGATAASTPARVIAGLSLLAIGIAAFMLWLGARKLLRFQATGAVSGEDLLMSGPSFVPHAFADAFRFRPHQSLLNLIRREFCLLRPVWLIALPATLYLALLGLCHILHAPGDAIAHPALYVVLEGPALCVFVGLAGLAGFLSLGEEKASGTHAWQMVLPIPSLLQWLVKLGVALFSGLACSVLLPVAALIAAGWARGSAWMYVDRPMFPNWLIVFSILTFSCFWCACAAHGTVRAAAWSAPMIAAISFSVAQGILLGTRVALRFGTLKDFLLSSFHLSPLYYESHFGEYHFSALRLFVPSLLFALVQSYFLFRAEPRKDLLWMLRAVAPLAAIAFLWSFSLYAGIAGSVWQPFQETGRALVALQPAGASRALPPADLGRAAPLSPLTTRWLAGSIIRVTPADARFARYRALIHLASGVECNLLVNQFGAAAASCADTRP